MCLILTLLLIESMQAVSAQELTYRAYGVTPGPYATPEPTPLPTSHPPLTIQEMICSYDWPCEQALRVAMCESTMNPNARNGPNIGLFQINYLAHRESAEALLEASYNIQVAYSIYQSQRWSPWSCKP